VAQKRNELIPYSKALFENQIVTQLFKNITAFIESECSIPCSQEPIMNHSHKKRKERHNDAPY
jgi:hypothetical protein